MSASHPSSPPSSRPDSVTTSRPGHPGHPTGNGHPGDRDGSRAKGGPSGPPPVDPALLYSPLLARTTRWSAVLFSAASVVTGLLFVLVGAVVDRYLATSGATPDIVEAGTLPDANQAPFAPLVAGISPTVGEWSTLVVAVLAAVLTGAGVWVTARGSAREEATVRDRIIRQILRVGPTPRAGDRTGAVVSMAMDGAERVAAYRVGFVGPSVASVVSPVLVLGVIALFIDWVTALVVLVLVPLIPAAVYGFQRAFRRVSGQSRAQRQALAADYLDALQGLTTLRLLQAAPLMQARLAAAGERNRRSVMRLLAVNQVVILVTDGVFFLIMVSALAVLAVVRLDADVITAGQGLALILMTTVLLEPLAKVGSFFYVGLGGRATERGIARILRSQPGVVGGRDPLGAVASASVPVLEFADVTCGYGDTPVLRGASFSVNAGEHVAIVGRSGAGKSTIVRLIERSLDTQGGQVLFGGVPVTDVTVTSARAFSAVVRQSTYLFTGTIRENLAVACPDASDEDMWAALARAHLRADVEAMPNGLDTRVGERGATLSGGQAQRLSLARALLSGSGLIVLDEPTSQVDVASERAILDAIDEMVRSGERTVVTITHRASSLRTVDRVVRVEGGVVQEVTQ